MLRRAIARGGLWFFGTNIFLLVIGGPSGLSVAKDGEYSFWEELIITIILSAIVGGCVMFKEWYDSMNSNEPPGPE